MRFRTSVELGGKTATGLAVPDEVIASLGGGRRPAVRVTVGAHTYTTTVGSRGGRFLVPLSAENRAAARVVAGDEVDVDIELDTAPRALDVPDDLQAALMADDPARATFEQLAPSHRKEWVRWIQEAKKAETRQTRLERAVAALHEGRKTR